jgi:hypothetical protein
LTPLFGDRASSADAPLDGASLPSPREVAMIGSTPSASARQLKTIHVGG